MTRRVVVVASLLVLCFASLAFAQLRGLGVIQGKTVNRVGAPLSDVTLTATLRGVAGSLTGRSDPQGGWKIVGMTRGTWDIVFERAGYVSNRVHVQLESELTRLPPVAVIMRPAQ